ncbi:MAG: thioredoxin family protein [Burkholderiales bacterium]|nr:thioredoxin family protein [Burkholderiales bacterium]
MSAVTLEQDNRTQIANLLKDESWAIYCLCAEWCDVCKAYRVNFDAWADEQASHRFIWIDIEDQADLVGDIDVENFPTLLFQYGDTVAFFGPVLPDIAVAKRLLASYSAKPFTELQMEADSAPDRRAWQSDFNMRRRLAGF